MSKWVSPVGELLLGEIGSEICLCDWNLPRRRPLHERLRQRVGAEFEEKLTPALEELKSELEEYFAGRRRVFDVALRLTGTKFQLSVWEALRGIPYGEVISYAELAGSIGRPSASRAVAGANSNNLISILVPCHRVIGAHGSLTGYAGGLTAKRSLLALEGAAAMPMLLS